MWDEGMWDGECGRDGMVRDVGGKSEGMKEGECCWRSVCGMCGKEGEKLNTSRSEVTQFYPHDPNERIST